MPKEDLKHSAFSSVMSPGERFQYLGDLRMAEQHRLDPFISMLMEIEFVDHLEARQSFDDRVVAIGEHGELGEVVVSAWRQRIRFLMVPDPANERAVFGPVRTPRHRQREV